MRRRRKITARINTKLLMDVIFASLIVQKAPALIAGFIPMDPMVTKIAGIGAGWITGQVANRPDISNLSLGLGLLDFVNPMIDQVIGAGTLPWENLPSVNPVTSGTTKIMGVPKKYQTVSDFINLNDYTRDPSSRQSYAVYQGSY